MECMEGINLDVYGHKAQIGDVLNKNRIMSDRDAFVKSLMNVDRAKEVCFGRKKLRAVWSLPTPPWV